MQTGRSWWRWLFCHGLPLGVKDSCREFRRHQLVTSSLLSLRRGAHTHWVTVWTAQIQPWMAVPHYLSQFLMLAPIVDQKWARPPTQRGKQDRAFILPLCQLDNHPVDVNEIILRIVSWCFLFLLALSEQRRGKAHSPVHNSKELNESWTCGGATEEHGWWRNRILQHRIRLSLCQWTVRPFIVL